MTDTVLDHLRLKRHLTGTKEGRTEGDCGTCAVLIGRLHHGQLRYETNEGIAAHAREIYTQAGRSHAMPLAM